MIHNIVAHHGQAEPVAGGHAAPPIAASSFDFSAAAVGAVSGLVMPSLMPPVPRINCRGEDLYNAPSATYKNESLPARSCGSGQMNVNSSNPTHISPALWIVFDGVSFSLP